MNIRQIINRSQRFIRQYMPLDELPQYVFIVGAQKAGTSALHSYMGKHPKIISGARKEVGFFNRESFYTKGVRYYRAQFPMKPSGTHALDATPEYLYYNMCAERIHKFRSDAKIIVILREPVSRAFSAFNMYQQIISQEWFKRRIMRFANDDSKRFFLPLINKDVKPDISYFLENEMEIINAGAVGEEPGLIRRGVYAPQLLRYFALFGRENVLVLINDELKGEPKQVVDKVFNFIGLEPLKETQYPLKHVREYTVDMSCKEAIREKAEIIFQKDKQELVSSYGINVPW